MRTSQLSGSKTGQGFCFKFLASSGGEARRMGGFRSRGGDDGSRFSSSEPNCFIKVISAELLAAKKLLIPSEFVLGKGTSLANVVVLRVPGGEEWQMEVLRCNGDVWFCNGWQEFAEFYSLKHGNFVFFNNQGNSQFSVAIVNETTCVEIKYPVRGTQPSRRKHNADFQEQRNDVKANIVLNQSPPNLRKRKKSTLPCSAPISKKISSKTSFDDSRISTPEASVAQNSTPSDGTNKVNSEMGRVKGCSAPLRGRGGESGQRSTSIPQWTYKERQVMGRHADWLKSLQSTHAFKSENPHFMKTVTRTNLPPASCMTVPATFANKFLTNIRGHVKLVLGGRSWEVKYKRQDLGSFGQVKFNGNSWAAFAQENALRVGDSCVFELINDVDITLRVFLLRADEQPSTVHVGQKLNMKKEIKLAASNKTRQRPPAFRKQNSSSTKQTDARSGKRSARGKGIQEDAELSERKRVAKEINSIVLENPYFLQVLKDYHRQKMLLPRGFIKATGLQKKKSIVVKDMEGRLWPVDVCVRKKQSVQVYLSTGLNAFLEANKLIQGDTIVFHFMKAIGELHVQIHAKGDRHNGTDQTPLGQVKSEPESWNWDD
ncbi:hypothetical protein Tsubulata_009867 [Turnera subulata]|uniref:TF-B3 domain-containing protein n=1 Tax=Turnera subulata TaxID=218843 RepID=A0A9Q0G6M7_9ROSI|nr:hypothetical protein Tsubulata_009867 [Turnera subulata]